MNFKCPEGALGIDSPSSAPKEGVRYHEVKRAHLLCAPDREGQIYADPAKSGDNAWPDIVCKLAKKGNYWND